MSQLASLKSFAGQSSTAQADQLRTLEAALHPMVRTALGLIPGTYGAIAQQADDWLFATLQKPGVMEWLLQHNPIAPTPDVPVPQPAGQGQ